MALTSAPLDVALPWLEPALDLTSASEALASGLRVDARPAEPCQLESASLIRHKPGRRALIEYVLGDVSGTSHRILLKGRAREADRRTAALHDRLADVARRQWRVPRALGIVPSFHGWLQERCAGVGGFHALAAANGPAVAAAVGGALAGLHTAVATDRVHDIGAEHAIATRAVARAAEQDARIAPRLQRIVSQLTRLARRVDAARPCLLHRDFYPDQVLIDGAAVVLLDLDLHAMGDPALDLGNFVAHLIEYDLRTSSNLAPLGGEFIEGYRDAGGCAATMAIDAYVTFALARHIGLSTALPGRRHTTAALIDLCECRLAGAS